MMRYLKVMVLSLAFIGLAFGSATAGLIDVNTPFTTAAEGIGQTCINDMDLDSDVDSPLGNAVGTFITYEPGIALNIGDKLTFTLTNATYRDAAYYLLVDETQIGVDLDNDGPGVPNELQEVGNWISGGSGSGSVVIRIANYNLPANAILYLVSSNLDANTDAVVTIDDAYDYNPRIRLACGLVNGSTVTLRVENAEDVGGTPLGGANASAQTIINVETQFAISFTRGTSTIDVTAPSLRTQFLPEGTIITGTDDTEAGASSGVLSVANDVDVSIEDYIDIATFPAALNLTLGNSGNVFTGLSSPYVDGDGVATTNGTNYNFSGSPYVASIPAGTFTVAQGNTWSDDVVLAVNGTTILTTQVWPLAATLNFTDTDLTDVTATDNSFVTWTINGYQAIIPYATTFPGFTTICLVDNTSTAVADVLVDILSSESSTTQTNLAVGTIPGRTTARIDFGETAITNVPTGATAAIAVGTNTRYAARLTVTADQNQVYVNCIQLEPGSPNKRMVPVLTDEKAVDWRQ